MGLGMNDFPFIFSKSLKIKCIFCFARLRDNIVYCFVLFRFHFFCLTYEFCELFLRIKRPFCWKCFTYIISNIILISVTQDELKMKLTIISFSPYFLGQYIIRQASSDLTPTPSSLLSEWVTASFCQSSSIMSSRHLNTTRYDLTLWKQSRLEWSVNQRQREECRPSRRSRWPLPANP